MISTPTMTSTPTRCHQTLTLLSSATIRTPKVFSSAVHDQDDGQQQDRVPRRRREAATRSRNALRNVAAPKSMPAVTATWPTRLNQPVNHDQAGAVARCHLAAQ